MAGVDGLLTMETELQNRTGANPFYNFSMGNVTRTTPATVTKYGAFDNAFDFYLYAVCVPIAFGLITIIGFLGNGLVFYVILSKSRMRSVTNLMLLNLAFSDLSFILVCVPFTAYHYAIRDWPFGEIVCKIMQYLLNVTVYVTIYTLVLISAVRYLAIAYPVESSRFRTKKNAVISIIIIWTVLLGLNIPIIPMYAVIHEGGEIFCSYITEHEVKVMYATFFTFCYALPLVIICTLHFFIFRTLRNKKSAPTISSTYKSAYENKQKASKVVVGVVLAFGMCWLPLQIELLVAYYGSPPQARWYSVVRMISHCLAYTNSCINPIIYNYVSREFRESFRETMRIGVKKHRNKPSVKDSTEDACYLMGRISTRGRGQMSRPNPTVNNSHVGGNRNSQNHHAQKSSPQTTHTSVSSSSEPRFQPEEANGISKT